MTTDNKEIKTTNSIKLQSTNIDDQLKFNEHISILCSKAAMQLNALRRLPEIHGKVRKRSNFSFILSYFNYCRLVWHLSSCESLRKIGKIQKRCLRIILNDYESDYETLKGRQNDIIVRRINTSRFGTQSLRSLGPKMWNNLPSNKKSQTFLKFKEYIKTWLGPKCRCKVCMNM